MTRHPNHFHPIQSGIRSVRGASPLNLRQPMLLLCLAVCLAMFCAPVQAQSTGAVFGHFVNQLTLPPAANPPNTDATSATFFGGHVEQATSAPSGGEVRLVSSSFGQMVANTIPYQNFQQDAVDRASVLLYYENANTQEEADAAAFRYRILYERGVESLLQRNRSVSSFWNSQARQQAETALSVVLSALKYDPTNVALWEIVLDIQYDIAVVYKLVAAEHIVNARAAALGPEAGGPLPPPGKFVISAEIAELEKAIDAYDKALREYYKIFTMTLGVDTSRVDPRAPGSEPFGHYVFRNRVPERSLMSGSMLDNKHPLLDEVEL